MKKFMVLAALLAGGVPSLWADHTKIAALKSVDNTTAVPFTYHAPDKTTHEIAPFSSTMLDVSLHHIPRTEISSISYFVSRDESHVLSLFYQNCCKLHPSPYMIDENGVLQERLFIGLSKTEQTFLAVFDSGLTVRTVADDSVDHHIHLTLAGNDFSQSTISVAQILRQRQPMLLNCARSLPASPMYDSDSTPPVDSPR